LLINQAIELEKTSIASELLFPSLLSNIIMSFDHIAKKKHAKESFYCQDIFVKLK